MLEWTIGRENATPPNWTLGVRAQYQPYLLNVTGLGFAGSKLQFTDGRRELFASKGALADQGGEGRQRDVLGVDPKEPLQPHARPGCPQGNAETPVSGISFSC